MTIEERAKEYEKNYPKMDDDYYSYYVRDGYIQGATDQQEIIINRACTALCRILCQMDKSSGLSCPCYGYKKLVETMEGDAK